jgi:signal transduction histidine kinase/DNA-binding NarL/FixJ family response regulator
VSWVSSLVADLVINKPLGLSPKHIEFRRAYLHDINPVGVGAMIISTIIGVICYIGAFGENIKAVAHFITIISAVMLVPAIAVMTKGKYYLARENDDIRFTDNDIECCICQNHYEKEDMAFCPAYAGAICSLCCSLDSRCQDICKKTKKIPELIVDTLSPLLPWNTATVLNRRLIRFSLLVISILGIVSALLALSYINAKTGNNVVDLLMYELLWKVFLILTIVAGVISWLFVLAHESQDVAREESQKQNLLLTKEVDAHNKTDKMLQEAKDSAEAANHAKSRYLTGISHELRSPLNSILGYAQLLEADNEIHASKRSKISFIRRSGEHLADLIEGLLDISQIEAGKLHINRNQVRISALLDQVVHMFALQAQEKDLAFEYECINVLPEFVATDEKRLRQILINLLSNAVKFTLKGGIKLTIKYKNQVAEIQVADTGIGIPEADIERIFKPFERVTHAGIPVSPGTGLGLTITQLLTDIMGGEIRVNNNMTGGTTFTVLLMLSDIIYPDAEILPIERACSYKGSPKIITVVDDDPTHRALMKDILSPLGFIVRQVNSGLDCLSIHDDATDLYLLDISMPNMNGWEVAAGLRERQYTQPIIIVSANANESSQNNLYPNIVDDHMIKPIKIDQLLEKVGFLLNIEWIYVPKKEIIKINKPKMSISKPLDSEIINELIDLAEIGHLSELKRKFRILNEQDAISDEFASKIQQWLQEVRFDKLIACLRNYHNE